MRTSARMNFPPLLAAGPVMQGDGGATGRIGFVAATPVRRREAGISAILVA